MAPAPDADPGLAGADRSRRLYIGPWRIDLTRREATRRVLTDRAVARTAAAALDSAARRFAPGSLAIVLTDDAELAELNAEHLGMRGPTDVLSFPMLPPEAFAGRPRSMARQAASSNRAGQAPTGSPGNGRGRVHLGDVAISVERAIDQAETGRGGQTGDVRWSPADELRLLVTHGALHVCGWDHAAPADETAMRAQERRLLARFNGRRVPRQAAPSPPSPALGWRSG